MNYKRDETSEAETFSFSCFAIVHLEHSIVLELKLIYTNGAADPSTCLSSWTRQATLALCGGNCWRGERECVCVYDTCRWAQYMVT